MKRVSILAAPHQTGGGDQLTPSAISTSIGTKHRSNYRLLTRAPDAHPLVVAKGAEGVPVLRKGRRLLVSGSYPLHHAGRILSIRDG